MDDQDYTQKPVVIKQRRGCVATLIGSALTIIVSAVLGAALALLVMWYGPRNFGVAFPDSTGRLAGLETAERTAVVERTDMKAQLRQLDDLSGSVETMRSTVSELESAQNTRETDLDNLQKQIEANLSSLIVLQQRIDELESIPANAALANRIAEAESQLATINITLQRMRDAFGVPLTTTPTTTPQP